MKLWDLKKVSFQSKSSGTLLVHHIPTIIQKFGFINGVDNVNWPPYRDSKS